MLPLPDLITGAYEAAVCASTGGVAAPPGPRRPLEALVVPLAPPAKALAGRLADPELRPLLYRYQALGTKDVLAPLKVQQAMYPENPDRDFGTSGFSLGDDASARVVLTWICRR